MSNAPHFICPRCGATSYNLNDIQNRYCGRCHDFIPVIKVSRDKIEAITDNLRQQHSEDFKRWYDSANFIDVEYYCKIGWLLSHYDLTDERQKIVENNP
jgi:hypothetical protein